LWGAGNMPEWVGTALFLAALGMSGAKIAEDFGNRGLRGYAMLMLVLTIYAAAVGLAYS
jgi:hypothetical protein